MINYLDNRQQYVQFVRYLSEYTDIDCGVPQGLILGLKLSLSDKCEVSDIKHVIMFCFFSSGQDVKTLAEMTDHEMVKLKRWFDGKKL